MERDRFCEKAKVAESGSINPMPEYIVTTATAPIIMLCIGVAGSLILPLCLAPLPLYFVAMLCAMSALPYAVMGGTVPSRSRHVHEMTTVKPKPESETPATLDPRQPEPEPVPASITAHTHEARKVINKRELKAS